MGYIEAVLLSSLISVAFYCDRFCGKGKKWFKKKIKYTLR